MKRGHHHYYKIFVLFFFSVVVAGVNNSFASAGIEGGMAEMAGKIVANSKSKNKHSIGITSFPHVNGDYSELSNYLADELVVQLFTVSDSGLEIIERNQMNKIFKELQLNSTGIIDSESIQKLGKLHGVDALVLGSITDLGEQIKINARLVDTETGRVFSAAGIMVPKTNNVRVLMERILETGISPDKSSGTRSISGGAGVSHTQKRRKGKGTVPYMLNLKQYEIGDIPEELGSVLVAQGKNIKGKRVLQRLNKGDLSIKGLHIHGDFTLEFTIYGLIYSDYNGSQGEKLILYSKGAEALVLTFSDIYRPSVVFGDSSQRFSWGKRSNGVITRLKIQVKGRVVKLFVNDRFVGSQIHDPQTTYDSLKLTLHSDQTEISQLTITTN